MRAVLTRQPGFNFRWGKRRCGEPWNNIECQNLLYQRRNCRDQTQRTQLSKAIQCTHAWKTQPSHIQDVWIFSKPGRHGGDSFWTITSVEEVCAFPVRYFFIVQMKYGKSDAGPFPIPWSNLLFLKNCYLASPKCVQTNVRILKALSWRCSKKEARFYGKLCLTCITKWAFQFPATGDRLLEYRSNTRVSPNFCTSVWRNAYEGSQCHDQFGFRPGTGVEHALFIFESVTEQSLEKGIWQTYYLFFSFVCSTPPTRVSWRIHSAADFALWFAMLLCGRKQHLCTINRESNRVMFLALPYSTLAWEMPWVHGNNALDVMVPA